MQFVADHYNALLKQSFQCLGKHRAIYHQTEEVAYIVMACAVLYNICLYAREPAPEPYEENPVCSLEGADAKVVATSLV